MGKSFDHTDPVRLHTPYPATIKNDLDYSSNPDKDRAIIVWRYFRLRANDEGCRGVVELQS